MNRSHAPPVEKRCTRPCSSLVSILVQNTSEKTFIKKRICNFRKKLFYNLSLIKMKSVRKLRSIPRIEKYSKVLEIVQSKKLYIV